jgi:polysaccharide export outer membrane protein
VNRPRPELLLGALFLVCACPHDPGAFIWVDDLKDQPSSTDYVIQPGDLINVRVFQQENMSARARVRGDGKISLPFLNDVMAAGYTPAVLAAQLQTRLKDFINNPVVTISLEEVRPQQVSVLGEVAHPGVYPIEAGSGALQVLAAAGGFSNFARKEIYVQRHHLPGVVPQRIRLDWEKLKKAEGKAATFALQGGDVVIVE